MTLRKRPRDPAQLAKLMIDIAGGKVEDRAKASVEWSILNRLSGQRVTDSARL
jgi:hypothetical protein